MKLLADLNISPLVVALLRRSGHEVTRVGEVLDPRTADDAILDFAAHSGAVLLSQDQDFSAILAGRGATRPSLLNLRLSIVEAEFTAKIIDAVLAQTANDLSAGAIVTIDDGGVRVRRLPVE
jgi:predicted nuclease of predicted toxin-antitoxin system